MTQVLTVPSAQLVATLEKYILAGCSERTACTLANVDYDQYQTWLRLSKILNVADSDNMPDDVMVLNGFSARIEKAHAKVTYKLTKTIVTASKNGDWQASAYLLDKLGYRHDEGEGFTDCECCECFDTNEDE